MQLLSENLEHLSDPVNFAQVIVHCDPHVYLKAKIVWQHMHQGVRFCYFRWAESEAQARFQSGQLGKVMIRGNGKMLVGIAQADVDKPTQIR
ncbi:type VI secretion system tip protein VgrG [Pseudomonas sp. S31]|nr:type VI secretion system tip protein VgrG [Pseudomonas sp. S31]